MRKQSVVFTMERITKKMASNRGDQTFQVQAIRKVRSLSEVSSMFTQMTLIYLYIKSESGIHHNRRNE